MKPLTESQMEKIWKENSVDTLNPIHKKQFNHLVGLKIVGVRYLTKEETEASAWYSSPIAIELSDGSALIPQQDEEGNDGGAIWIANSKGKSDLIPVIRV